MDIQSQSRFLLVQRLTLLVNRYDYFLYEDGEKGEAIAHAEQKRFAFREQMTVWSDEARGTTLFTIRAEKLLDVHGKFLVEDAQHTLVGYCRKSFKSSLLRSTWEVCGPDDAVLFIAREESPAIAIARRIAQFIPVLGDLAPFVPFNFIFEKDGRPAGSHRRVWGNFKDTYQLQLDETLSSCDRRLPLALGILLDALQER